MSLNLTESSKNFLNIEMPSYPGSTRKIHADLECVPYLLDTDDEEEFLVAAETGDVKRLELLIKKGVNIHHRDEMERNALHYAVYGPFKQAVRLLLEAGVDPNVKSIVGMTPLSLCLMRSPWWTIASMLFDYGAVIIPRSTPMDTGLFLQFIMMCKPNQEEEKILRLLVEKGAQVNDPTAPGGRQGLHFAAMSNNCILINILIELGANPFLTNHRHETPRQVAYTFKCREAQKLLGEHEKAYNETVEARNALITKSFKESSNNE